MKQKLALQKMPRPPASVEILEVLEELREAAMDGKMTAFMFVSRNTGEVVSSGYSRNLGVRDRQGLMELIGEAECLKERLKDRLREVCDGQI